MNANEREWLEETARRVIGASFEVSNQLGAGFLEKVYENALAIELRSNGLSVEQQKPVKVQFKGQVVGDYVCDLLIEQRLLVELKCVDAFAPEHMAQCLNYLRATKLPLALLINFHRPKVEFRRIVLDL